MYMRKWESLRERERDCEKVERASTGEPFYPPRVLFFFLCSICSISIYVCTYLFMYVPAYPFMYVTAYLCMNVPTSLCMYVPFIWAYPQSQIFGLSLLSISLLYLSTYPTENSCCRQCETRFDEFLPLLQNFKSLWEFVKGLISIWHNLNQLRQILVNYLVNLPRCKWPNIE